MEAPIVRRQEGKSSCIDEILVEAGLQRTGYQASSPAAAATDSRTSVIVKFLLERVPDYSRLAELRRRGWANPSGDRYFNKQRHSADKPDRQTSKFHYRLMRRIGEELHNMASGLFVRTVPGSILDFCAAPGGFLATAMALNPGAEAVGFSLPPADGGYSVVDESLESAVTYVDITMMAVDMGVNDIPQDHPDGSHFLPRQLSEDQLFDLVICDGNVLRTHKRKPYRESREALRLRATQLALGLKHMKPKGTMLVLLHRIEDWDTTCLLRRFSEFSSIRLYKPTKGHIARSSFYMVAANIQIGHPNVQLAIEKWKAEWKAATFGSDEDFAKALVAGEPDANELLSDFGAELIKHGRDVWSIQAHALAQKSFTKQRQL